MVMKVGRGVLVHYSGPYIDQPAIYIPILMFCPLSALTMFTWFYCPTDSVLESLTPESLRSHCDGSVKTEWLSLSHKAWLRLWAFPLAVLAIVELIVGLFAHHAVGSFVLILSFNRPMSSIWNVIIFWMAFQCTLSSTNTSRIGSSSANCSRFCNLHTEMATK